MYKYIIMRWTPFISIKKDKLQKSLKPSDHSEADFTPFHLRCTSDFQSNLPTAQRLMSGPSSMSSGQAQVYLGEWSVICGAFRQRYSQPPLGKVPILQASGAGGIQARTDDDFKEIKKNTVRFCNWFLKNKYNII